MKTIESRTRAWVTRAVLVVALLMLLIGFVTAVWQQDSERIAQLTSNAMLLIAGVVGYYLNKS